MARPMDPRPYQPIWVADAAIVLDVSSVLSYLRSSEMRLMYKKEYVTWDRTKNVGAPGFKYGYFDDIKTKINNFLSAKNFPE